MSRTLGEYEDRSGWEIGLDGGVQDPWSLQYLLPLEDRKSGELVMFMSAYFGGKRAIATLCNTWSSNQEKGLPVISLECGTMPTKYGEVRALNLK